MIKVNLAKLYELVEQKYLTVQKHPNVDLSIFNYTAKAQYDANWTEDILMCRGLIVSSEGEIVARPFEKFFNLSEYKEELPDEPFDVFEKLDGSLGILYWVDEKPRIATRGSFVSKQAIRATEILRKKYSGSSFDRNLTYLFEIIYPENRIVIDYGETEDLILLAVRDTETGKEINLDEINLPFKKVKKISNVKSLDDLASKKLDNQEGFVIKYKSGFRLKIKFAEYVRLHKLVTGLSEKAIWELLSSGTGIDELLDKVPDEFYGWVKEVQSKISHDFLVIEKEVLGIVGVVDNLQNRGEQARYIKDNTKYTGAVFAVLDKKDYRKMVWGLVKPQVSKVFKEEI